MIWTEDIHNRIRKNFQKEEVEAIENKLKKTIEIGLNVGENQFVRSVIFLANKNKEELERILNYFDDPRDVLLEAEEKSGNLDHWFAISFEEIEKLNGKKYSGDVFKEPEINAGDELPF